MAESALGRHDISIAHCASSASYVAYYGQGHTITIGLFHYNRELADTLFIMTCVLAFERLQTFNDVVSSKTGAKKSLGPAIHR